jgi:hypothetical protein
MKNFFKKHLRSFLQWTMWGDEPKKIRGVGRARAVDEYESVTDIVENFEPLRLTVAKAIGGYVVTTKRVNNDDDYHQTLGSNKLSRKRDADIYVLTDDQHLPDEISKIVGMEMLKI